MEGERALRASIGGLYRSGHMHRTLVPHVTTTGAHVTHTRARSFDTRGKPDRIWKWYYVVVESTKTGKQEDSLRARATAASPSLRHTGRGERFSVKATVQHYVQRELINPYYITYSR